MMELLSGRLDTFQRVLGMTLMTLPIWIGIAIYALWTVGPPSFEQLMQSFIVAISSGVIATTLFFMATDLARNDQGKLAAVEATQSTELIFAMIGEMITHRHRPSRSDFTCRNCRYHHRYGITQFPNCHRSQEKTARHLLGVGCFCIGLSHT